jgi:membrane-associated protease RseP (regulator of RpoE activity)
MTLTKEAGEAPPPLEPDTPPPGGAGRILQLLVVLGLVAAVFIALGWGYLLLFIAILIVIVMLHELGHFATAKWAGMKVTEYFVGFGPRLWSVRRGETEYGVKAIPAGGYVRITGFTSTEDVPAEDEPRAYRNQPFHQRIIVASAGSVMHFLIAIVLALVVVLTFGTPGNNISVAAVEKWSGVARTPAVAAGLRTGDVIVSINGRTFSNPNAMTNIVKRSTGKPLVLGVERDGHLLHLTATPRSGKGITVDGQHLQDRGYLGVSITPVSQSVSALGAFPAAFSTLWRVTDQEVTGIAQTFSPSGLSAVLHQDTNSKAAQQVAENPGSAPRPVSIVGIANLGSQAEQAGLYSVLVLLIAINVVFGLLNLLPMIPLDGGHVAIAVYERARTRRGSPYYRADITKLFPVAFLFIAFLSIFVLSGVFLDITHPLQIPGH